MSAICILIVGSKSLEINEKSQPSNDSGCVVAFWEATLANGVGWIQGGVHHRSEASLKMPEGKSSVPSSPLLCGAPHPFFSPFL